MAQSNKVLNIEELQREQRDRLEGERRSRGRKRRMSGLMKLVILVLVVLLLIGAIDYISHYDLSTRVGNAFVSFGGPGYPVPVPGGLIRDVQAIGPNLAVLNDTNLHIYNRGGRQVANIQHLTERSAALTSRDRALVYDFGGRRVSLHSLGRELHVHTIEDMVLGAALGEGGEYAIITSPRNFIAQVEVFNSRSQSMMTWGSRQHVRGAAISPRGDMLVADCVDSFGGVLGTELVFLRFDREEELLRVRLEGELVVWMSFISYNRIAVLTDRAYRVFDNQGRAVGVYAFAEGEPLMAFQSGGERMLLLCGARESHDRELVLLDSTARRAASVTVQGRVLDIALGSRNIWLLTDSALIRYNIALENPETLESAGMQRIKYVDGRLYYFTRYEIRILEA